MPFDTIKIQLYDQMILVYHATASTDLLWVLPVKTEQEPNPKVDHISLFTQIEKDTKSTSTS